MHTVWNRTIGPLVCVALAVGLGILAGCGSGGSSSGDGTLTVRLADAPDPSCSAVNVTLDRVEVNVNGEWKAISDQAQTYNLLELARTETTIGSIVLPPGRYTQIRLFPSNVTVEDADGIHPVTVPSGDQTGIKINIDFDVAPNQACGVLLDFNVAKSIVQLGNGEYHLKPVIPAVVQVLSGTITGTVVTGKNADKPVKGAIVAAIDSSGAEANSTMTLKDGTFKIWALMPGTYTLEVTSGNTTVPYPGVIVQANEDTAAGSLALP